MVDSTVNLLITIDQADIDAYRLDELTYYLMRDLQDLGVEATKRTSDENPPKNAKGEPLTWGVLALSVMPNLVPRIVEFAKGKLCGQDQNTCRA
jgi:hypothetical protein